MVNQAEERIFTFSDDDFVVKLRTHENKSTATKDARIIIEFRSKADLEHGVKPETAMSLAGLINAAIQKYNGLYVESAK